MKTAVRVANTVTVTVDGYSAHTYQLQRSTDLAGTTFTNLGSPQAGSTGTEVTFSDSGAAGDRFFYRVVVD